MRNIVILKFFVIIILVLQSCGSKGIAQSAYTDKYSILDSLNYVDLPDDDFGTKGNYYFKKIVSYGDEIIPYLIERVTDTTATNEMIADVHNLRNSDIAVQMLEFMCDNKLLLWDILFDEFSDQLKDREKYVYYKLIYERTYLDLFFSNSEEQNYQNRVRLCQRIRKWYMSYNKQTEIKQ